MDKAKAPGIAIQDIRLVASNVQVVPFEGKPEFNLQLLDIRRRQSEDGKFMSVIASFDLMHGLEKRPLTFTCTFLATYSRAPDANMSWEEFTDALALTHIIPYLREYVSNTTNRLPTPVLILPPINVFVMLEEHESRKQLAAGAASKV